MPLPSRPAALAALLICVTWAQAPKPPTLAEALKAQRSALSLEQGRLAGPGAERLRKAAEGAQFVLLGEDHGIHEIAAFAGAWFSELAAGGHGTLAVEDGPEAAKALESALRTPEPQAALARVARDHPFAVAFYDLKPEAAFLERVAKAAGPRFELWGFDQELMGAGGLLLARMREAAEGPARARVEALQKQEAEAYRKAAASGNPTELFMMSASPESLRELEAAAAGNARTRALAEALLESRAIYERNMDGRGWESNVRRAGLMKRTLGARLDADPGRRLLVKVGALHAYRGTNPLGSRELGAFLAERAEGRGTASLHVMVLAAKGRQARFAGVGRPPEAGEIEAVDAESPVSGALPVLEAAKGEAGWSLFDLRPLRPRAKGLSKDDAEVRRLLEGFDFVLVIPEGTPEV